MIKIIIPTINLILNKLNQIFKKIGGQLKDLDQLDISKIKKNPAYKNTNSSSLQII